MHSRGAGEVDDESILLTSQGNRDDTAIIQRFLSRRSLWQMLNLLAHHTSRVRDDFCHDPAQSLRLLTSQLDQTSCAMGIRRQLCMQICQVVCQIACWVQATGEQLTDFIKAGLSSADQVSRRDDNALLNQAGGIGWHGPRRDAADLRMMGSIGDVTQQCTLLIMHRRDKGDIRQMGSTKSRMIGDDRISRLQAHSRGDFTHANAECAEMNWDMWRAGNQTPCGIKQGAGKIQTLTDVRGDSRAAQ